MGINIGAFLAPLTCGAVAEIEGWNYGFLCAGIGMVIGLSIFLYTVSLNVLGDHADPPSRQEATEAAALPEPEPPVPPTAGDGPAKPLGLSADVLVYLGTFLAVPLACLLIYQNDVMDFLLIGVGAAAIGFMLFLSFQYPTAERQRIWVLVVMLFISTIFWTFFELAGSALSVFTDLNVDKNVMGLITLATSQFQAFNAIFIVIFAPLFSMMWIWLNKKGWEPAAPLKFAIAVALVGAGFLVLNAGKGFATAGVVPAIWLILLYLLHTLGELALSPVGLSVTTKLAPAKVVGFMMGFWFLSTSIAHQAGKWISNETVVKGENATAEQTLEMSLKVFNNVGLFALGAAGVIVILSPVFRKWMHGVR